MSRSSSFSSSVPPVERPGHDVAHELFLEPHVGVRVVERNLGLDHPEFGEMAPGLRLLGAKGGTEAVDLAVGRGSGFHVELSGLSQVGVPEIEVLRGKEIAGFLADGSGQDWGVDQNEVTLVEEVSDRLDHLVAHPGHCRLTAGSEPQVSMLEEESRPMLFRSDRVVLAGAQHLYIL